MIETSWLLFLMTSVVLIATPGQDMMLVMSRSIGQGPAAGVATAAGVSVGLVGHTLLAALGLGAILRASELLFTVLKLVGAAYLIYLGIKLLLSTEQHLQITGKGGASLQRSFLDGAVSNLSNPKIAMFYFAFLPQFVPPSSQHPTLLIFLLGLTFVSLGIKLAFERR